MNSLMNFVTDARHFTTELISEIRWHIKHKQWAKPLTLLGFVVILIAPTVIAYVRASA